MTQPAAPVYIGGPDAKLRHPFGVTPAGLAEAGWREAGTIDDSIELTNA